MLVGLGAIGMGYDLDHPAASCVTTHARAFTLHEAFGPLVGVDPSLARRHTFTATFGGAVYASLQEALQSHAPNVAVIATPTASHPEVLFAILERSSPRVILCEKPLASEPTAAQHMVEACRKRDIALYVNYMRRADPAVDAVRRMIAEGRIASPLKGVVWYSKGLVHNGSHFVDLMRHWLGAVCDARLMRSGRRWADADPEPDFVFEYARGSVDFMAANEECFSHYTAELVARNGRLRYEAGGGRVEWQGVIADPECAGYRILAYPPELLPSDMTKSQLNVVREIASVLSGHGSSLCSGGEGLETLRDIYRVIGLL